MMVHPIYLMTAVLMNPLPVQALFHLFAYVVPPVAPIVVVLPSPICEALVPSVVSPSAHATPSLFPPFFSYPSAFTRFTCRVVSSSPLLPKLFSAQVGLLGTCNFVPPPCC